MLVIPAFKACMQSALIRANIKPPVELVVANLDAIIKKIKSRRVCYGYEYCMFGSGRSIST